MATTTELIKRVKENTLENNSKSMYEVILKQNSLLTSILTDNSKGDKNGEKLYEVVAKQNALLTSLLKKIMDTEQPAPIVKINVDSPVIKMDNKASDIRIPTPVNNINVEQPVNNITVEPSKPIVTIQKDEYDSIEIEIERDRFGNIEKLICKKVR